MTTDFEQMLKIKTKIRKLMGLAAGNTNPAESKSAMAMAQQLARKHGIDITTLQPLTDNDLKTPEEKMAAMRRMFSAFGPAISKTHPGVSEDYLKSEQDKEDLF